VAVTIAHHSGTRSTLVKMQLDWQSCDNLRLDSSLQKEAAILTADAAHTSTKADRERVRESILIKYLLSALLGFFPHRWLTRPTHTRQKAAAPVSPTVASSGWGRTHPPRGADTDTLLLARQYR
jgi:hypothetical protein